MYVKGRGDDGRRMLSVRLVLEATRRYLEKEREVGSSNLRQTEQETRDRWA